MTLRLTPIEGSAEPPRQPLSASKGPVRGTKGARTARPAAPSAHRSPNLAEPPPATLPFPSGAVQQMHEAARELRAQRLDRVTHRKSAVEHAERALRQVEVHSQALLNQLATEAQARIGALRQKAMPPGPAPEPPSAA